ncbi:MAG: hypothetical protein ACYC44_00080 [Patescibacteria group bacterium]
MAGKKPGGDAPKKPSVAFSFIEEAAEFATGVVAGQAFASVLRAGATGAINALRGSLFKEMFTGLRAKDKTPDKTDTVSSAEIETAKSKFRSLLGNSSGDAKLTAMAEAYVTAVVNIQLSNRSDKTEAINNEKAKYRAAVNEYLLGLAKQSLQNLMAQLSDLDARGTRGGAWRGRPVSYRADFMQWLDRELTPTQRDIVLARRNRIATVRVLTDMLDSSPDPVSRFTDLTFSLGEPSTTELVGEFVKAATSGHLDQHPTAQKIAAWSGSNVSERQELAEMETRSFANRRKV